MHVYIYICQRYITVGVCCKDIHIQHSFHDHKPSFICKVQQKDISWFMRVVLEWIGLCLPLQPLSENSTKETMHFPKVMWGFLLQNCSYAFLPKFEASWYPLLTSQSVSFKSHSHLRVLTEGINIFEVIAYVFMTTEHLPQDLFSKTWR